MMIQFPGSNDLNIPVEDILYRIEFADPPEIDAMIQTIRSRYSRLHPDWEVLFISIHTKPEAERRQDVESLIQMLRKAYLD